MHFFEQSYTVLDITLALSLKAGTGTPLHKNRPTHGIAFNVGCETRYTFSSGENLICHSGECIFLPKGSSYTASALVAPSDAVTYAVNFDIAEATPPLSPVVLRVRGKAEIEAAFSRAALFWQKKEIGFREETMSLLYRIIAAIRREAMRYAPMASALDRLSPALSYINEHYTVENIPLSRLAFLCGISETYLRRLFQSTFSLSPVAYMRNMRIKYAKELLRAGEHSVTEIAMLAGFNDTAYFSREFKKAVGVSPKEYAEDI